MKYLLLVLIILPVALLQQIGVSHPLPTHLTLQLWCRAIGNIISGFLMAFGVFYLHALIRGKL